jgi:hypothetical protein
LDPAPQHLRLAGSRRWPSVFAMLQTALLLLTTTVNPPPDFADQVTRAEVEITDTEATITGYDGADQAIGSISYWTALAMASTACACLPLIFKDGTECW